MLGIGNGEWGIGNWELGIGHRAWGMGHGGMMLKKLGDGSAVSLQYYFGTDN